MRVLRAVMVVVYLAAATVVILPAILIWDWFHGARGKGFIAAVILVALIVLPILAFFAFCLWGPGQCRT